MRTPQIVCALALALFTAAIVEAQGKPGSVPVGPPPTPVEAPSTPPSDPPDSLIGYVCSLLPVPYLCD